MFIIRCCLLWSLVSLHIVAGAVLFRRLFPKESPWFGFVVPALALVLFLNFTEHQVAIPTLHWLLPFTLIGSLWLIVSPKTHWRGLLLPTCIFLASFAFTIFLRFLKPDISQVRDGIYDMQFISSFCMGQSLPVESTWIPPLKLIYYYLTFPRRSSRPGFISSRPESRGRSGAAGAGSPSSLRSWSPAQPPVRPATCG